MAERFEFHAPHDHELHHAAQHGNTKSFQGTIAVVTAVLATIGALFSYEEGKTQAEAILYKNNAAIAKTEANDQWSYYQAKGVKLNVTEMAAMLVAKPAAEKLTEKAERYRGEQEEIKKEAEKHEAASKHADEMSETYMHQHHRWAQAMTLLQVSIALSAIALLTQRKWLLYIVFGVSGVGVVLGGLAWFGI
ncbi:MAG: DUF4337 domain-containing protein [Alphaproteobacteria bacterium]|nr:DUF4337 domain-containing protein [Alphaproteobacteria bacterium]